MIEVMFVLSFVFHILVLRGNLKYQGTEVNSLLIFDVNVTPESLLYGIENRYYDLVPIFRKVCYYIPYQIR